MNGDSVEYIIAFPHFQRNFIRSITGRLSSKAGVVPSGSFQVTFVIFYLKLSGNRVHFFLNRSLLHILVDRNGRRRQDGIVLSLMADHRLGLVLHKLIAGIVWYLQIDAEFRHLSRF